MSDAVQAECLLAALGRSEDTDDPEYVSAYVGALFIVESLTELRRLREALTTTKKA